MASLWQRDASVIAGVQKLRFFPLAIVAGDGCEVIADDGRRLLDMTAAWGAASLGYGHPAIRDAVSRALAGPAGASILSATHEGAVTLAESLVATAPDIGDARVWFGHSGSDATECAQRAIAAATGRARVIAFHGAYHGGTAGSMAISGHSVLDPAARAAGLVLIDYPDPYRPTHTADSVIADLVQRFASDCPPGQIGALFIEPIQSDGGLIVPPPDFLARLSALCQSHGILVVADEVKVGLGRSGLFHCSQHEGVRPDMICLGKGLGGGLPISAVIGPARILNHATAFAMQTLHGNPACTAAAQAVLDTIRAEGLIENARAVGQVLRQGLLHLKTRHACVGDVRGRGLVLGVEMADGAGNPWRAAAVKTVFRAYELGLVVHYVGLNGNVLELTPPLILTEAQAMQAVDILGQAISDVEAGRVSDAAVAAFSGW